MQLRSNRKDILTRKFCRNRSNHSSHESQMTYSKMLPIAQQLKQESGTRYSAKYLISTYKTPQALKNKLAWVRGCKASAG